MPRPYWCNHTKTNTMNHPWNFSTYYFSKLMQRLFWSLLGVFLVWVVNSVWYKPFDIDHFYARLLVQYALEIPEELSKAGFFESYGIKFHNDELSLPPDEVKRNAEIAETLEMLVSYKRASQTPSQLLSTDILHRELENRMISNSFALHDNPINHLDGVHLEFPNFMIRFHRIDNLHDAEQYIARLSKFHIKIDSLLVNMKIREEEGLLPPKIVIEKSLEQLREFIQPTTRENILFLDFQTKVRNVEVLTADAKHELFYEANMMLTDVIYPSYQKLIDYYEKVLQQAPEQIGIERFMDGVGYYHFLMNKYTEMDEGDIIENELIEKADEEVRYAQAGIRRVMNRLALDSEVPVGKHMAMLLSDTNSRYSDSDNGRENCLQDIENLYDTAQKKLAWQFYKLPTAKLYVRRMPLFKEKYAPLYEYMPVKLSGSRYAISYVNLRHIDYVHRFMTPATVYMELMPGNHFRSATQRERSDLPSFRRLIRFHAHAEGWKMYALKMAEEQELFKNDNELLGKYYLELLYAVSMRTDIGIHHQQWTRTQAYEYFVQQTGMHNEEAYRRIDEIIIYPAKSWAYFTGRNKILELRTRAMRQLVSKYNPKEFHQIIVGKGLMPLDLLEIQVENYIAERKQR